MAARIYLYQRGKTVITSSKIDRVWLTSSISYLIRVISAGEVVKKALKKGKNDILHIYLGYMDETHCNRMISMVNVIEDDPTKIRFCESCISTKITKNSSTKSMIEVTTKLNRVYIDLWRPSTHISLKRNCYMWTVTYQAIRRV